MKVSFKRPYSIAAAAIVLGLLILHFSGIAQSPTNAVVNVDRAQVTFLNIPAGGTSSQTINITSTSSTAVAVNATGAPSWLQVSPNGSVNVAAGTPTPLTVQVVTGSALVSG